MNKYTLKMFFKFTWIILFLFLVSSFLAGCNNSKTTKIDRLEWEAIAEIQEWKSCDESGWEVPEGANVYQKREEIKYYETIGYRTKYRVEEYQEIVRYIPIIWRPIYETKTRTVPYQEAIKEPVYATKYYYTIEHWVFLKNVVLASGYDHEYNYPEYICAENERVHNIKYKYLVHLECDESYISYVVDKEKWESLYLGKEIAIGAF